MLTTEELHILIKLVSDAGAVFQQDQLNSINTKLSEMLAEAQPPSAVLGPGATAEMVWNEVERQKASPENPFQITRKQLNAIKLIATPSPVWNISPGHPPTICGFPYVVID